MKKLIKIEDKMLVTIHRNSSKDTSTVWLIKIQKQQNPMRLVISGRASTHHKLEKALAKNLRLI